ncbi:MAG: tRNA (uridine(34)/cytosine(34)/5-carboxymethylaminomethyluridine(34)-2'-O)-methyltransferase TrmL [Clostridiales Family XIII bacterium]|jgi:tRNA (cytidine/uridine-2'-O-)-methyltransferase|nr:tRNA (uridine(34)/cytosine(34)/5-carboxymethylaminomethyluridine(34)-2'-O)-methyltransferase TrmL [Clostridiales Family XIII bacterium]
MDMSHSFKPFHIVLVEPEIPPNTGNIARTCAATGTHLHLVAPLGFEVSDRSVRRAGLDYWPYVKLHRHDSLDAFLRDCAGAPLYFVSTKGKQNHADVRYEDGAMLVFGKETKGLPENLLKTQEDRTIRIPMLGDEHLRSLNLANSAAIVLYEALRQKSFLNLQ